MFFQYGGDVFALLSGGAGEVVFFEDFVQADAGGRAAGKVEDVARGVVRVGKRQKAAGGQFGRVERGLQPVVVIGPGRAVAELERNVRITEGIFKFITVRLAETAEEA